MLSASWGTSQGTAEGTAEFLCPASVCPTVPHAWRAGAQLLYSGMRWPQIHHAPNIRGQPRRYATYWRVMAKAAGYCPPIKYSAFNEIDPAQIACTKNTKLL